MTWRRGLFRLSTKSALFFQFSGLLYNPFMALVKCLKHFFSKISNFSSLKIWRFCFFHPLFAAFFPQNAIRVRIFAQNAPIPRLARLHKSSFLNTCLLAKHSSRPAPAPRSRAPPAARLQIMQQKTAPCKRFLPYPVPSGQFFCFHLMPKEPPLLPLFAFFAAFSAFFAAQPPKMRTTASSCSTGTRTVSVR